MIQRKEAKRTNLRLETWFPWLTRPKAAARTQHMAVLCSWIFRECHPVALRNVVCLFIYLFIFDIVD